jgi:hypothetical protein
MTNNRRRSGLTENPLFLPLMTFFVGILNTFLNGEKWVSQVWWYTLLPLLAGFIWSSAVLVAFMVRKSR